MSLKTKPYKYNRIIYGAGRGIKKRSGMGKKRARNEVGDEVFGDKEIRMNRRYFSVKMGCQIKNWGKGGILRYAAIF